jgi:hypothetical protein
MMTRPIAPASFPHEADQQAGESLAGPRPIFVIGSMRSGASLLTLCLGQHANIRQVADNSWLRPFVERLQKSYAEGTAPRATAQLAVSGVEVEEFFARFGESVDQLMLGSFASHRLPVTGSAPRTAMYQPRRWVDGTTTNSLFVFPLIRLFPQAKFIHVLRDVNEVVASLTDRGNHAVYKSHSIHMDAPKAYDHWRTTVLACVAAEQAFGTETVLRIRRADLVAEPEATLRRCLDFLGEPFTPSCLRPFR